MEMMWITTVCPICGEVLEFDVPADGYRAWKAGELIQNAMPNLIPEYREMLISHICPVCWDAMFSDEEEDIEYEYDDYDETGFNPYMGCYDYDC